MKKCLLLMLLCASCMGADLCNDRFTGAKPGAALPPGWLNYGAVNATNFMQIVKQGDAKALRIVDQSQKETGVYRDFPIRPGWFYRGTVQMGNFGKARPRDVISLQMRFLIKNNGKPVIFSRDLKIPGTTNLCCRAPENAVTLRIYVFTSFAARMDVLWKSFRLEESRTELPPLFGDVKHGFVPPVLKLKDMCRNTPLDKVTIQCSARYRAEAKRLAAALEKKTGKRPAIVSDRAKVSGHRILLGSRDTNAVIEHLYRRYFAYTDMVYPGKGGYEFRTVHNPFGDKVNYIILGGSDDAGVKRAVDRLIERPEKVLPPVIDVRTALPLPEDVKSTVFEPGFGWNTLSWLLESYYRSGKPEYAREFIRLGLHPAAADMPKLKECTPESFWDFLHPISTPYHYNGHYLMLLWDLVEEQDVFTDEERLAVTRAFARQIIHPDIHATYRDDIDDLPPSDYMGDRHGQWATMMLYVLSRYMNRDYPHPVWANGLKSAAHFHEPVFRAGAWGEPCNLLSWFASGMLNEPAQYVLLSGSQCPLHPDGMLMTAMKVFEIIWDPGRRAEANTTMTAHNHRLFAALTGDGKYHYYARNIERPDSPSMKFGQSYRSVHDKVQIPAENTGKWLTAPMPPAGCRRFGLKPPYDGIMINTGYRDSLDMAGDRVLFDLFNEIGRAPYQLNAIVKLRINGVTYLDGDSNYLQVVKNGAADKHIPVAGLLRSTGVSGNYAFHTSAVPDMAHGGWERTLLLKKRKAALIADRVTAKTDGPLQTMLFWTMDRAVPVYHQENRLLIRRMSYLDAVDMKISADGIVERSSNSKIAHLHKAGDSLRAGFRQDAAFTGEIKLRVVCDPQSAVAVDVALDGKTVLRDLAMDHQQGAVNRIVPIGKHTLSAGDHTITLTVTNPGSGKTSDVALWQVHFIPDGPNAVIAGAGLESGRDFHKGATPALKPGEHFTFFTVCGIGVQAEQLQGHPEAALLMLPEKTLAFSGEFKPFGKGRVVWVDEKETALLGDDLKLTVHPTSAEARTALAKLSGVPFRPVSAAALPQIRPDRVVETGFAAPVVCPVTFKSKPALFAGSRGQAKVLSADGETLLALKFPGRVLSLHGTGKMLLIGTVEDKIHAYDETGKLLWTHQSDCATPFGERKHYYWFRGFYPGVYSLTDMNGEIYAGSACTTERITADGKLVKRYEQLWGVPNKLLAHKRSDGSSRLLCCRLKTAHDAGIFVVDPAANATYYGSSLTATLPGFRNFPEFGCMIRKQAVLADVDGDGREEIITTSAGKYSWIQIFDEQEKVTHQVNFGGKPATTDLAADRGIIVTVDPMRRMMIFDRDLKIRKLCDLAGEPLKVVIGKNIAVLERNGESAVTFFDRDGRALKRLPAAQCEQMVQLADGTLAVISRNGRITFCSNK